MDKPLILTGKDDGAPIEEEIDGICHRVKPKIFCRSSNLLVVDTGNWGHNPLEYVKVNGKFSLLVGKYNATHGDFWNWWYTRDPSRNYEHGYHYGASATDHNLIFLYWDDLDNLPEVEYGQRHDAAIFAKHMRSGTFNVKVTNSGVGIRTYDCQGLSFEKVHVSDAGRGIYHNKSPYNYHRHVTTERIGRIGVEFGPGSKENVLDIYNFDEVGICESTGALYFTGGSDNCTVRLVRGSRAYFARYWPMDGSAIFFEQGVSGNVVRRAYIANSFNAVEDNSGMPGNCVMELHAFGCTNAIDQADASRHGEGWPVSKILRKGYLYNSGPHGVRTPPIPHLEVTGDYPPQKSRYEHELYPDLPDYRGFDWETDAVNPAGKPGQTFRPFRPDELKLAD